MLATQTNQLMIGERLREGLANGDDWNLWCVFWTPGRFEHCCAGGYGPNPPRRSGRVRRDTGQRLVALAVVTILYVAEVDISGLV